MKETTLSSVFPNQLFRAHFFTDQSRNQINKQNIRFSSFQFVEIFLLEEESEFHTVLLYF